MSVLTTNPLSPHPRPLLLTAKQHPSSLLLSPSSENIRSHGGPGRWLSAQEHIWLLQRTRVRLLAIKWWLTTVKSSFRDLAHSWGSAGTHACAWCTHTHRHSNSKKLVQIYFKNREKCRSHQHSKAILKERFKK